MIDEATPVVTGSDAADERRDRALRSLKPLARAMASVWVAPRLVAYRIASRLVGRERAFAAASESIARLPGNRGVYCRQAFYRRALGGCGRDVYFGWMSTFSKSTATVGDRAYIGRQCSIGMAHIGSEALLADGVQVLSGRRQHEVATAGGRGDHPPSFERVEVGAGAWLGAACVVMADVGPGSIVAAGAVVVDPVPPRTVVAGVPARVVRHLGEPPTRG